MFSRTSNFLSNLILARYGGPAVLGIYSATLSSAIAVVSPVLWSLSTSATLEAGRTSDQNARRAIIAAHVGWALLIAVASSGVFLILQHGGHAGGLDAPPSAALATLAGLSVVICMLVTTVLQGALQGMGAHKPFAARLIAVSFVSVVLAFPAVIVLGISGALATLSVQYVLLAATLVRLGRPSFREREQVRRAFATAKEQLICCVPNILATLVAAGASWLTSIYFVGRSHGLAGVGVCAVGSSWLTITMMPATAWGSLSLRVLSDARASSPEDFRSAVRQILMKDMLVTLAVASVVFLCAAPLSRLYGMTHTPLPTILRVNLVTAVVMAATQTFERAMFCLEQQRVWMRAQVFGSLCMLAVARWLIPLRLEYVAVAMLCGFSGTAVACAVLARRGRWL